MRSKLLGIVLGVVVACVVIALPSAVASSVSGVTANSISVVFDGLQCGTAYTISATGGGATQTLNQATSACSVTTAPTAPIGFHVTAITDTSVSVAWDASPSSQQVDVYQAYMDDTGTPANGCSACGAPGTSAYNNGFYNLSVTDTNFTYTGLTAGSTHYLRIGAHNAVDYGPWTDPALSVTTTNPSPPPPPPSSGRWYSDTSPFNVPIPANPVIRSDSTQMINGKFVPQGSNNYNQNWLGPRNSDPNTGAAAAVATPAAGTPNVTVQINYPSCNTATMQVPIPVGFDVGVSASSENKAVIFDPSGNGEWDFFDITPPNTTTYDYTNEAGYAHCAVNNRWQALVGYNFTAGGFNATKVTPSFNWSDSNFYLAAGIIRKRDLTNTLTGGYWDHALVLDYSGHCASGQTHPLSVFPATGGDGRNTGISCAPMGTRWQLDPSINCDTWGTMVGKPEWLHQMCKTLQVYGMISGHSAACQGCGDGIYTEWYKNLGGYRYPWQNADGSVTNYYAGTMNIPTDLLSHFRVLDWNWHWAGGNP